jgi:Zn-dependent protease with chaperone function
MTTADPGHRKIVVLRKRTAASHEAAEGPSDSGTEPKEETDMSTGETLNSGNLAEPREKVYFAVALGLSIPLWLLCVVTLSPILIVGILVLFGWLANGLLVARLRAEAVKVDARQLPDLAATLDQVCRKLGVHPVPDLYILQAGGLLNAFVTRHCGRNFVVVSSDLLEAYGPAGAEMEFLLGHELGHIQRKHLLKQLLVAPGLLLPLLGNAYSRACEASCDRYGAYAASNTEGAIRAALALAGGRRGPELLSPEAVARQYVEDRGFFVSWYELISGYPTLSHRLANLIAVREGRKPPRLGRNPLAYLFAFFTFGARMGGGANVLITVAVIGLLAAIAIPSFVKARSTAQLAACLHNLTALSSAKVQAAGTYGAEVGQALTDAEMTHALKREVKDLRCPRGGIYTVNAVGSDPECSVHGSLSRARESRANPSAASTREGP